MVFLLYIYGQTRLHYPARLHARVMTSFVPDSVKLAMDLDDDFVTGNSKP